MAAQHISCLDFGDAGSERWRALVRLLLLPPPPPAAAPPAVAFSCRRPQGGQAEAGLRCACRCAEGLDATKAAPTFAASSSAAAAHTPPNRLPFRPALGRVHAGV